MSTTARRLRPLGIAVFAIGLGGECPAQARQVPDLRPPKAQAAPASGSCTTECHQDIVAHRFMHGPSESKCDACHIQGNPKEHKFYFIVQPEQLCIRCHQLAHEGPVHAPVLEGQCMSCHDPHGSDFPRALVADPRGALCRECHERDFARSKFVHGPVAVGACIVCHRPHSSKHENLLSEDPATICLTCHSEVKTGAQPGLHMHAALEQGCTRCHDAHASDHQYQLLQQAPELCLACHQDHIDRAVSGAKVVHGAIFEEGGCTGCHEPHSSTLPSLQRGAQPDICLRCHDRSLKTEDGTELTNMRALLAENPDHHGPIREGNCTACHDAHAGDHFRLLKEEYPPEFYAPFRIETFDLCFKCHIPDLVLNESGSGLTQFRDGDRNLHYLHVNQEKGRTCRACHEVHASKRPAHVREAVPFGSSGWLLEINFKQTQEGGSCAPGCHLPKNYRRTGILSTGLPPAPQGAAP